MKNILILGLGNFLLKDEGLGVHFASKLANEKVIPSYVEIEDGATGGINLLYLIEGYEKVIVIDAMDFNGCPGEVKKVSITDISQSKSHLTISLHGINFLDIINLANSLSIKLPNITIIGVQPEEISQGIDLTSNVEKAYEKVKELVFEEIKTMNKQKHILIIDDDPDIVEAMKIILESKGYRVSDAPDGSKGKDLIKQDRPDMIILDVMMRTIDEGFHVCYELKNDPETKNIPILVATAVAKTTGFEFDPKKDENWLPADDYVNKPVMPDDLIARVNKLIDG